MRLDIPTPASKLSVLGDGGCGRGWGGGEAPIGGGVRKRLTMPSWRVDFIARIRGSYSPWKFPRFKLN